jgi:hypothetical protein
VRVCRVGSGSRFFEEWCRSIKSVPRIFLSLLCQSGVVVWWYNLVRVGRAGSEHVQKAV